MDALTPLHDLAAAGGKGLQAVIGTISALRPADKPLHPEGAVTQATLSRYGGPGTSGAEWLDGRGDDEVTVRLSRAVGLPDVLPDIHGLAMRAPTTGGGHGDLLLASTGLGTMTRFTLTASRSPWGRPLTTLLPYRTPSGPVLISAVQCDDATVELAWAHPTGEWTGFAELRLRTDALTHQDEDISFDPVLNTLPGLDNYPWVRRLRSPSYRTARRSRDEGAEAATTS